MLDQDIKSYHAAEVSALATNGGRVNLLSQIISGVVNNVWPHVNKAKRTAGGFLYRKIITAAADDNDGTLMAVQQYIDRPTLGEDYISAFVGTATDTQGDIAGAMTGEDTQPKFGAAYLTADIAISGSTATFTVEHLKFASGAEAFFQAGRSVRLTNMPTPDSGTGTEEDLTILTIDSVVGLDVTMTFNELFANAYTAGDGESRAISNIEYGDVKCSVANFVVTAGNTGTAVYDDTTYPVVLDNLGTIEDSLTFQATDATHFSVTGTSGKTYSSWDTAVDYEPINPDNSKSYLKLLKAGLTGTPDAGDTITMDINDARYSTWYRQEVPVDCPSLANNKLTTVTVGESDS